MASTVSRAVADPQSIESREGLSSWWSRFKSKPTKREPEAAPSELDPAQQFLQHSDQAGIFNVPLQESITYANVAISLYNDDGQTFIYGYIPIVVAKCGLFLKDNATETEGIFRLSGSAKRIKDLQAMFDLPPKYGKGLDWTGFTVHDAANILRRYLNHLPDPIIPYDWYDNFRQPLKEGWQVERTIPRMQELVASLPALNRQLLLYILDLLAVFASKSEINRMTSENLSAIFQPGLITHPRDDMAPQEYRLSQEVLVFLIDNQSHFLLDSLCVPTTDRAPSPPGQKKTGLLRRRTLQTPKRSPSVRQTSSPVASNPRPTRLEVKSSASSLSAAGSLSRSNTVPTKRNPPLRSSGSSEQVSTMPRHVSSPAVGRGGQIPSSQAAIPESPPQAQIRPSEVKPSVKEYVEKDNHELRIDPAQEDPVHTRSKSGLAKPISPRIGPNKKVQRIGSPLSFKTNGSRQDEARVASNAHHLSLSPDLRNDSTPSRRTSQASSSIANEAEFSIIGGRRAAPEHIHPTAPMTSSVAGQRPMSMAINMGANGSTEKPSKTKEPKVSSSSPSKFSNLFKKKPRHQSVSSTSETGSRRDLDK